MFETFVEWLGQDKWFFILCCEILVLQIQLWILINLLIKRKRNV